LLGFRVVWFRILAMLPERWAVYHFINGRARSFKPLPASRRVSLDRHRMAWQNNEDIGHKEMNMPMPWQQKQDGQTAATSLHEQSRAAFYRDLPDLLKKHCGLWVAYHGEDFVGSTRTQAELFDQCLAQGLEHGQFIVAFADYAALADHEEIELPWSP
jgi:hypothetical protein